MSSSSNILKLHSSNTTELFSVEERNVINHALSIIEGKFRRQSLNPLTSPTVIYEYLRLQVEALEREVFGVLFLDSQNRLIANEVLFKGTINSATIYPREVVKRALELNANATVFYHNHPSGSAKPSDSDIRITEKLKDALNVLDIRAIDHFIIGSGEYVSFAERGII